MHSRTVRRPSKKKSARRGDNIGKYCESPKCVADPQNPKKYLCTFSGKDHCDPCKIVCYKDPNNNEFCKNNCTNERAADCEKLICRNTKCGYANKNCPCRLLSFGLSDTGYFGYIDDNDNSVKCRQEISKQDNAIEKEKIERGEKPHSYATENLVSQGFGGQGWQRLGFFN